MEGSLTEEKLAWYFNPLIILGSMVLFGPLGLLLVWFRPRTNIVVKIIVSVIVLAVTIWFTYDAVNYYRDMTIHLEEIAENAKIK